MSTRFDNNVLLDADRHFGFGSDGGAGFAEGSLLTRIITAANLAAVNGVVTAPQGSIALLQDGSGVAVNTDGGTTWSLAPSSSTATVITDPGNAGAIPVTGNGTCALVTAGAETRTIAIPSFLGQTIVLTFDTDGGNCVVTAASAIDEAGNTVMTFADIGETITLQGASRGGVLFWSVQGNDGVALS